MIKFSKNYNTYYSWIRKANKTSKYSQRIVRLHKLKPLSTLPELRNLTFVSIDLSRKKWALLTSKQKYTRNLTLEVLRRMRKGESLSSASGNIGLGRSESLTYLGKSLFKKSGKWFPKTRDVIERAMKIYENGEIKTIIVTNSDDASLIGEYYNAVRNYLYTGDSSYLKPFKKKTIIDAYGNKHRLETNPKKVRDIEEAKEDSEFFEVYSDE